MTLFTDMNHELADRLVVTENGALMEGTSGKALLDMNFSASTDNYRDGDYIYSKFHNALMETPMEALKWLFYARDCRGGMGFRNIFREIMVRLLHEYPHLSNDLLELVPEYGYWKDLNVMYGMTTDANLKKAIIKVYANQLTKDVKALNKEDASVSLAGKYAPTDTSKKKSQRKMAVSLMKELGIDTAQYRKMNRLLRNRIKIVEKKMSQKEWDKIDYNAVPSKANRIYTKAFARNDSSRYAKHLEDVKAGKNGAKMNVGQNFPHEILKVAKNTDGFYWESTTYEESPAVEAMWKEYPRENLGKVMVVEDRSGSMTQYIDGNNEAMEVADALTLLFSEQLSGEFKNSFITFSERPKLWHLAGDSVISKLNNLITYSEVANTNIKGVFDLLLRTAVKNHYTKEDMPETILILSDMEFDYVVSNRVTDTLFKGIAREYAEQGYTLPRIVFWNLAGRTGGIPLSQNEAGVALVSGFSPSILKMVLSGSLDPWENLKDCLNSPRYEAVAKVLEDRLKKAGL